MQKRRNIMNFGQNLRIIIVLSKRLQLLQNQLNRLDLLSVLPDLVLPRDELLLLLLELLLKLENDLMFLLLQLSNKVIETLVDVLDLLVHESG